MGGIVDETAELGSGFCCVTSGVAAERCSISLRRVSITNRRAVRSCQCCLLSCRSASAWRRRDTTVIMSQIGRITAATSTPKPRRNPIPSMYVGAQASFQRCREAARILIRLNLIASEKSPMGWIVLCVILPFGGHARGFQPAPGSELLSSSDANRPQVVHFQVSLGVHP